MFKDWLEEEERRYRLLQEERSREQDRGDWHQKELEMSEAMRRLRFVEEENLRVRLEGEKLRQCIAQSKGSSYGTSEEKDGAEGLSKEAETTKEEAQTAQGKIR